MVLKCVLKLPPPDSISSLIGVIYALIIIIGRRSETIYTDWLPLISFMAQRLRDVSVSCLGLWVSALKIKSSQAPKHTKKAFSIIEV